MPKNKAFRYTMFGSLYFPQGTILSYFTALNALYLLSHVTKERYQQEKIPFYMNVRREAVPV